MTSACDKRRFGTGVSPAQSSNENTKSSQATTNANDLALSLPKSLSERFKSVASLSRWNRPLPSLLLMWPCWWSAGLATAPATLPAMGLLGKFALGAYIMRGAGCTINDILDRDIDGFVERTRTRALASGDTNMKDAIMFLAAQLSAGLAILLTFEPYSIVLGASSLGIVGVYPLMKRISYWPQLVLGLAFNWGALIGWASVAGTCNWAAVLPLYVSGISWTLIYDTIYAHQDKHDDVKLGLKSTALRFGDDTKLWLSGFAVMQVSGLAMAGAVADMGTTFYGVSVLGTAAHLAWQISTVDLNNSKDCMSKFLSNVYLGGLVAAGIGLDKLLTAPIV